MMSLKSTQSSHCCTRWQKRSRLSFRYKPDVILDMFVSLWLHCSCVKWVTSPLTSYITFLKNGSQQGSNTTANTGTVVRQGTGAELSGKAPWCTLWFIVWGLHRNKRLFRELKGQAITAAHDVMFRQHMILIKSCKCASAIRSMFFVTLICFLCVCIAVWGLSIPKSIVFSDVCDAEEMWLTGKCLIVSFSFAHIITHHKSALVLTDGCRTPPWNIPRLTTCASAFTGLTVVGFSQC